MLGISVPIDPSNPSDDDKLITCIFVGVIVTRHLEWQIHILQNTATVEQCQNETAYIGVKQICLPSHSRHAIIAGKAILLILKTGQIPSYEVELTNAEDYNRSRSIEYLLFRS